MFRTPTRFAAVLGLALLVLPAFAQFDTGDRQASQPWSSFKINSKTKIRLDFKNANIDLVIGFLSKTSGITIVKDPGLTGPITVTSGGPVSIGEAFEILKSFLSIKGYNITKEANHLVVKQGGGPGGRGNRPSGITGPNDTGTGAPDMTGIGSGFPQRSTTVLKVYPIQYASAAQVSRVLNDVFSGQDNSNPFAMMFGGAGAFGGPGGRGGRNNPMRAAMTGAGGTGSVKASADDYSNSVIVNASEKDQSQVADLIRQIDKQADAPMQSKVYKLEYAVASDLAPVIQNVLTQNAPKGKGGASATTTPMNQLFGAAMRFGQSSAAFGNVVAETRTNSLVVTATDDNIKVVGSVIKELDKEIKYEPSTFVFPLANARADLLATLLTNAFGSKSGSGVNSRSTTTSNGYVPFGGTNLSTTGNRTGSTSGTGSRTLTGEIQGNDANQLTPEQIDLALKNPGASSGELLTQINAQGFGGFGGFGFRGGGTSSTSGAQNQIGMNNQGKLVNVRDLTGQVTIIADPNTNSLIVVTLPENAELIKKILAELDRIPEQVMIETIIVEATLDASEKFGVEWKYTQSNLGGTGNTGTGQQDFGQQTTPLPQGFRFTMTGGNLTAFLNLLKTDSRFSVLSTPRIFTANNSQAQINISQSIPYVLSTIQDANGNISYSYAFQDVGIVLTVLPRITSDGYVAMDITQTANDLQGYTSFNAPIVNQRQATTSVAVKDGETIILGGIIRNSVTTTTNKIPILGDIPLLGNLFKSSSKSKEKTELLVFLTPRVIRDPDEARKLLEDSKKQMSDEAKKSLNSVAPTSGKPGGQSQGNGKPKGGS